MRSRRRVHSIAIMAGAGALALGTLTGAPGASATGALPDAGGTGALGAATQDAAPATLQGPTRSAFSAYEVSLLAAGSGLGFGEQDARLAEQQESNETLTALRAAGHDFDGAFLDAEGGLVVRADAGTRAARAAQAAGAAVEQARFGEERLTRLQRRLAATDLGGVAGIEVDVPADRVVVRHHDALSAQVRAVVESGGSAVRLVDAPANSTSLGFRGGDGLWQGGGYCSAGFPARDGAGTRYMIWAGHCNENGGSFTLGRNGTRVTTSVASAFKSYDGLPDRDIGYTRIDAGHSLSTNVNPYGSGRNVNAPNGASKPAVGTQMCKSGATTGVTCGAVLSYNNTVNYVDSQGRQQASVSGLMRSSVCTAPGDSGGAYTSGGFAVGLTSGGPQGQTCRFDGGVIPGASSYVQPVTDALAYYRLTYGG